MAYDSLNKKEQRVIGYALLGYRENSFISYGITFQRKSKWQLVNYVSRALTSFKQEHNIEHIDKHLNDDLLKCLGLELGYFLAELHNKKSIEKVYNKPTYLSNLLTSFIEYGSMVVYPLATAIGGISIYGFIRGWSNLSLFSLVTFTGMEVAAAIIFLSARAIEILNPGSFIEKYFPKYFDWLISRDGYSFKENIADIPANIIGQSLIGKALSHKLKIEDQYKNFSVKDICQLAKKINETTKNDFETAKNNWLVQMPVELVRTIDEMADKEKIYIDFVCNKPLEWLYNNKQSINELASNKLNRLKGNVGAGFFQKALSLTPELGFEIGTWLDKVTMRNLSLTCKSASQAFLK